MRYDKIKELEYEITNLRGLLSYEARDKADTARELERALDRIDELEDYILNLQAAIPNRSYGIDYGEDSYHRD